MSKLARKINVCFLCGKNFLGYHNARYCLVCASLRKKEQSMISTQHRRSKKLNICNVCGINIPKFKQKCEICKRKPVKYCHYCGKQFFKTGTFCSPGCFNNFRNTKRIFDLETQLLTLQEQEKRIKAELQDISYEIKIRRAEAITYEQLHEIIENQRKEIHELRSLYERIREAAPTNDDFFSERRH